MSPPARILVVGSANVDLVTFAERLPEAGETVSGTRFLQTFGGKGANQAVMAARFEEAVAFAGAVGDDANGRAVLGHLRSEGIDVADVAVVAASTGVAPIWVDGTGENRIIVVSGANAAVDPARVAAAVERVRPAVVVGQFEIPQAATAAAFAAARRIGAVTVLNPAPGAPIEQDLLAACDWLVPNETELAVILGEPVGSSAELLEAAIDDLGARLGIGVVVTLGGRGAIVRPPGGPPSWVAAPAVAAVVDTTGAGDAFVAGLAVGLARSWPPDAAVRLGCAAGAESVTRPGAQASYPDPASAVALAAAVAARNGRTASTANVAAARRDRHP